MKELDIDTRHSETNSRRESEIVEISKIGNTIIDALATSVSQRKPSATLVASKLTGNQFICDLDLSDNTVISANDLPDLAKMTVKVINTANISTTTLSVDEALSFAETDIHKQAILSASNNGYVYAHSVDNHILIPREGNISETSNKITENNFLLLGVSGVYWQGSEKNKMIQRIQGAIFQNKQQKDEYLKEREELEKRDHVRLGKELRLFTFDETAPGEAYWLPKGLTIYNELLKFWREAHSERGYQEIASPLISKASLYETSGHMDHYKENMFIANTPEGQYVLKPMNCPNAMVVFKNEGRSYKDLPLRLSDTDRLHRFERAGEINGLLRARSFQQDDAHIFLTEDQIGQEFENIFEITDLFYATFGLDYSFRLSTRGSDFMGNIDVWNNAETTLHNILEEQKDKRNKTFEVSDGDAAFYGPKIDILMKDAMGRNWQMGTIQLDFQLPTRFNLGYTGKDGQLHTPVLVHRVIYGSLERFIGIITEHFGGNFPTWISPEQVVLVPVTDKNYCYAQSIAKELKSKGIRIRISNDQESRLGKKIYEAKSQKTPYILVLGDKEETDELVTVNVRQDGINKPANPFSISKSRFIDQLTEEINTKSLKPQINANS